jgi:hypothetical protein
MIERNKLLDGLLLFTPIRVYAFEKMKTHPRGWVALDLEVHQYLFISNAPASRAARQTYRKSKNVPEALDLSHREGDSL